jgi:hypothetical protein
MSVRIGMLVATIAIAMVGQWMAIVLVAPQDSARPPAGSHLPRMHPEDRRRPAVVRRG